MTDANRPFPYYCFPLFPAFPPKHSLFTFVLSNNAKNYQLSQTFLSKHLEGIKKRRTFAPAFPNKAYAEKGRAIKTSDLWRDLHKTESSTRSGCFRSFWPGRIRVKKKSRPFFWNRCFEPNLRYIWMSVLENRDKVFPFSWGKSNGYFTMESLILAQDER